MLGWLRVWGGPVALMAVTQGYAWGDPDLEFRWLITVGATWCLYSIMLKRREMLMRMFSEGYRMGRQDAHNYLRECGLEAVSSEEAEGMGHHP